jgi:hypothetical protein
MARLRLLLVGAVIGALLMLSGQAVAQSVQVKHFACYAGGSSTVRPWYYLPNGADPCPTNYTKIDWIDD